MTSVQCYSSTFLAPSVLRKNLKIHIFSQQKASIANNSQVIIDFMQKWFFFTLKIKRILTQKNTNQKNLNHSGGRISRIKSSFFLILLIAGLHSFKGSYRFSVRLTLLLFCGIWGLLKDHSRTIKGPLDCTTKTKKHKTTHPTADPIFKLQFSATKECKTKRTCLVKYYRKTKPHFLDPFSLKIL